MMIHEVKDSSTPSFYHTESNQWVPFQEANLEREAGKFFELIPQKTRSTLHERGFTVIAVPERVFGCFEFAAVDSAMVSVYTL